MSYPLNQNYQYDRIYIQNYHLKNPDEVYELTTQISKFWSVLSEEDKDYVQAAQYAIEEKQEWKI